MIIFVSLLIKYSKVGKILSILVVSVILFSFKGTFKSSLSKTFFPFKSLKSSIFSLINRFLVEGLI